MSHQQAPGVTARDPVGPECGKAIAGRTVPVPCCLGPQLGRLEGWGDMTAGGSNYLKAHHLSRGGGQQGLLVRASTGGLSMWLLGLPQSVVAGLQERVSQT